MRSIKNLMILLFSMLALNLISVSAFAGEKTDRKIIAFLVAINNHEIEASKNVKDKLTNQELKDFATLMITDHGTNLEESKKLSTDQKLEPRETSSIRKLKIKSRKELDKLATTTSEKLDKLYLELMIKDHKFVIGKLDNYIKDASNKALKNHLMLTRVAIAQHLEKAKAIKIAPTTK